jgi:hypothetical protein
MGHVKGLHLSLGVFRTLESMNSLALFGGGIPEFLGFKLLNVLGQHGLFAILTLLLR